MFPLAFYEGYPFPQPIISRKSVTVWLRLATLEEVLQRIQRQTRHEDQVS